MSDIKITISVPGEGVTSTETNRATLGATGPMPFEQLQTAYTTKTELTSAPAPMTLEQLNTLLSVLETGVPSPMPIEELKSSKPTNSKEGT